MAGNMQIFVLEKAVYEMEEKLKKTLKQIEEKIDLQDKKFKEYEKFLRSYEGGASLPAKIEGKDHIPGGEESEYGKNLQKEVAEKRKEEVKAKSLKRRKKKEEKI